jgi:hypothetical protein
VVNVLVRALCRCPGWFLILGQWVVDAGEERYSDGAGVHLSGQAGYAGVPDRHFADALQAEGGQAVKVARTSSAGARPLTWPLSEPVGPTVQVIWGRSGWASRMLASALTALRCQAQRSAWVTSGVPGGGR